MCLLSASPKLRGKKFLWASLTWVIFMSFRLVYASFFSSPFRIRSHFRCYCCCCPVLSAEEAEWETMEMMNEFLLFISTQYFHVDVAGSETFYAFIKFHWKFESLNFLKWKILSIPKSVLRKWLRNDWKSLSLSIPPRLSK